MKEINMKQINFFNYITSIFFIGLVIISCKPKKENSSYNINLTNNNSFDTIKEFYQNGNIKSIALNNKISQNNKIKYYITTMGDTIETLKYNNNSYIFYIKYDSQGNKIEDKRIIYLSLEKWLYKLNDTVIISCQIKGPDKEWFSIAGTCKKIFPDTNINNGYFINNKYFIYPKTIGIYEVKVNCIDEKIIKVIGENNIIFEVN